jgi:hypothetical protein
VDRRYRPQTVPQLRWLLSAGFRFALVPLTLPLHIVTGSDKTHEKSLLRLLESIERFEPSARTTVWNLGLSSEVEARIAQMDWVDLRVFNFGDHPDYFDIRVNAGEYAWKPTIINNMNSGEPALLVWLDAGNLLLGELTWLRKIVGRLGFFSPSSPGSLMTWTHPRTLEKLGFADDPRLLGNLSANIVGYRTDSPRATALIQEWAAAALDPECIAPQGSSRLNHRQDQAVLSVLAIQRGFSGKEPFRGLESPLNIAIHQDVD